MGGVVLVVAPLAGAVGAAIWLLVFAATRYASLASLTGAVTLWLWAWLLGYPWPVIAFAAVAGVAVVVLHRANIGRLVRGEENRFRRKRASTSSAPSATP